MVLENNIVYGLNYQFKQIHFVQENEIEMNYYFENSIEIKCTFTINKNQYQTIFIYTKDYLSRFETSFNQPFSLLYNSYKKFNAGSATYCKLTSVFEAIQTNKLEGTFNSIFIESQALLILLNTHSVIEERDVLPCYSCKFLNIPTEKQKILQARVLMLIHISEPLSIPQLAKAVHMNECYLKKGFKEMFGSSIFDYIQQERIKKAKQLLLNQKESINDIAIELGYSNTSNFTNAFKKNTGFAPSEWQRMN